MTKVMMGEHASMEEFKNDLQKKFPALFVQIDVICDYENEELYEIWLDDKDIEQDPTFDSYLCELLDKHFYNHGIFNFMFGYNEKKALAKKISDSNIFEIFISDGEKIPHEVSFLQNSVNLFNDSFQTEISDELFIPKTDKRFLSSKLQKEIIVNGDIPQNYNFAA